MSNPVTRAAKYLEVVGCLGVVAGILLFLLSWYRPLGVATALVEVGIGICLLVAGQSLRTLKQKASQRQATTALMIVCSLFVLHGLVVWRPLPVLIFGLLVYQLWLARSSLQPK